MRAREFIAESQVSIGQHAEGGDLEGYVVDTNQPNLSNYLSGQGASNELINEILTKYDRIGLIRNMYVDPDYRGQGIGNDLVGNAIDSAAAHGAKAVILVADTAEENAINLVNWYESFGFEVNGQADGDPVMVMEL